MFKKKGFRLVLEIISLIGIVVGVLGVLWESLLLVTIAAILILLSYTLFNAL